MCYRKIGKHFQVGQVNTSSHSVFSALLLIKNRMKFLIYNFNYCSTSLHLLAMVFLVYPFQCFFQQFRWELFARKLCERPDCFYQIESDTDTISYSIVYSQPGNHYRGIPHRRKLFPDSKTAAKFSFSTCRQAMTSDLHTYLKRDYWLLQHTWKQN